MSTRIEYLNRARACTEAAEKVHDPTEQVTLLKVSACYMALADYVAARQEHGRVHREADRQVAHLTGC